MSGNDNVLSVYLGKKQIASLIFLEDKLLWKYTSEWQVKGYPVSPHLPLTNDIPTINISRFLRNLLPEGPAFDELIENIHVSRNNIFALVRALGLDTSGALIFLQPEVSLPEHGTFRELSKDELISRLDNRESMNLIIWDEKPRLSVAGIQDKINVVINDEGKLGFGENALCSTHLLKFEKKSQTNFVLNEYVSMKLAKACGLNVANVELRQYGQHMALLVERFDRRLINNTVKRRHIIDSCQALNYSPEYKYERNFGSGHDVKHIRDGVSLPKLFSLANLCQNPALTKQQILDWVLFNILIYNADAHGKNISFFVSSQGISITPFYDLVNIKMYPNYEQHFAMALGDEFDSNEVHAYQLADFADSCQLARHYLKTRFELMIKQFLKALPELIEDSTRLSNQKSYLNNFKKITSQRSKYLSTQLPDIKSIHL